MTLRLLLRNLGITLVAVVAAGVCGLIVSVPVNYVVDAEASSFAWSGGVISSAERVDQHRQRTFVCAVVGAIAGLVAAQSVFWLVELRRLLRIEPQDDGRVRLDQIEREPGRQEDDPVEPAPCVSCGAVIPGGIDTCSECGWSYKTTVG